MTGVIIGLVIGWVSGVWIGYKVGKAGHITAKF